MSLPGMSTPTLPLIPDILQLFAVAAGIALFNQQLLPPHEGAANDQATHPELAAHSAAHVADVAAPPRLSGIFGKSLPDLSTPTWPMTTPDSLHVDADRVPTVLFSQHSFVLPEHPEAGYAQDQPAHELVESHCCAHAIAEGACPTAKSPPEISTPTDPGESEGVDDPLFQVICTALALVLTT